MNESTRAFDDFTARMSDSQSCVLMRDFIAHYANPVRLKLLCRLVCGGRLCVNELVEVTGEKQSTVSQQLKQLQMARMVHREREGNRVYYSVANPVVEETMRFFSSIASRVDEFQGGGSGRL
ncbi:MAG: metalloregulator ArsR/SmtB family transcription factor [Thermoanaerobaculales bacterium]|nr:metalloregulator ArsR/SmtB family transcription factor [Thermoanaerobaculales bacterium]